MIIGNGGVESALNLTRVELPIELQKNFYALRNTPLFYVSYCKKLNSDEKVQRRVVICTLDHFYTCHPNGDILRCFPYDMIERIIHDPIRQQIAVVVPLEYDVAMEVPNTFYLIDVIDTLRSLRPTTTSPMILQYVLRRRRDPKRDGLPSALLGYPPAAVDGEDAEAPSDDNSSVGSSFDDCDGYLATRAPKQVSDQQSHDSDVVDMFEETYYSGPRGKKAKQHEGGSFESAVSLTEFAATNQQVFNVSDLGATFAGADTLNVWPEGAQKRKEQIPRSSPQSDSNVNNNAEGRARTTSRKDGQHAVTASPNLPASTPASPLADPEENTNKKPPLIEQCRDWWYYFRQAVPIPFFSIYPKGVIPNWNDKYYKDPNASERVKRRRQRSYRAQYEGKALFNWLFWRERGARERMSIHNPLMPASEEPPINVQHILDHDPFVFGENVAGQPNEVCIGKAPYTVRLARPADWRLCLYTGAEEGGEEEFELPSGE